MHAYFSTISLFQKYPVIGERC